MSRREFHFSEGASNKFWAIEIDGKSHTVQFGRIGTSGQTQSKEFSSEDEAKKSYEKLVAEKVKKGYVEQSGTVVPASSPTASAVKGRPAPKPKKTEAAPELEPETKASVERKAAPIHEEVTHQIDLDPED